MSINETQANTDQPENGTARMSLELPVQEMQRVKAYARDKQVTAKFVVQRALLLYFEKVNERENGKYMVQPIDNRDIL